MKKGMIKAHDHDVAWLKQQAELKRLRLQLHREPVQEKDEAEVTL